MLKRLWWSASFLSLTGVLLASCNTAQTPTTTTPPPQVTSCPFGLKLESPVSRCGQLSVPASYADPAGQQYLLPYVVFSTRATPSQNATMVLQGGPGAPSGEIAWRVRDMLRQAQPADDLIVFDQRGTGES